MLTGLKRWWRWSFGYKADPPPRGRVNEPGYAEQYEAAGRPSSWPAPGGKYRESGVPIAWLRKMFTVDKAEIRGHATKVKLTPVLRVNRIWRSQMVNPETGGKGVWVKPYSHNSRTGLEEIHEDQSPSKG